jgi:hypothetical protein
MREGLGGPPKCNPGEAEGTPVEVFPVGGPGEGTFVRREHMNTLPLPPLKSLYAVYKVSPTAYRADYWPAGDYGVVFLRADNSFLVALVEPEGIVRLDYPAASTPEDLPDWIQGEWILPPVG